jgi:hypothetical protein
VLVQFWGEKQPVVLQPESTPGAEYPRMHEYEIRCPVLNFQKYLLDMKNNLKIEVEGEGAVSIDFKSLLVKKYWSKLTVVPTTLRRVLSIISKATLQC